MSLDSDGETEAPGVIDFAADLDDLPSKKEMRDIFDQYGEDVDDNLEPFMDFLGLAPDLTPNRPHGSVDYVYTDIDPETEEQRQYVKHSVPDVVRPGKEFNTGEDDDSEDDEDDFATHFLRHKSAFHSLFDFDYPSNPEHKHQPSADDFLKNALASRYADSVRRSSREALNERSDLDDPRRHGAVLRYPGPEKDDYHILETYNVESRLRDASRGMLFLKARADMSSSLQKVSRKALDHKRGQYGFYVNDMFHRFQADRPESSSKISHYPEETINLETVSLRNRVGRQKRVPAFRGDDSGISYFQKTSLNLPVYSSVEWEFSNRKNSGLYKNEQKNMNRLLSEKLGLKKASDQLQAKNDAIQFFKDHFGLDVNSFDGSDTSVTMIPYSITKDVHSRVNQAEGHLASWFTSESKLGNLGNGRVYYRNEESENKDGSATRTTPGNVLEVGWMIRASKPSGLLLSENRILPKGEQLVTGYWVIERPSAIPSLMHFQSAGASLTTATRRPSGTITKITSMDLDVYDMLHDIERRPSQGVGRARTIIVQEMLNEDDESHGGGPQTTARMNTILAMRH